MIKVCYVISSLTKGGAERQLYELVKGINRKSFEPMVICLTQGGYWSKEIQKLNIQVIELQRRKKREFTRLFKLIRLLKVTKPDIVHTYLFSANSYGRVAAIIARVSIIIASERSAVEKGMDTNRLRLYIDKLLSKFTDAIICNSHKASYNLIENYSYNSNKVFTICNGISAPPFVDDVESKVNKKSKTKIIGIIGSLYYHKNHKLFLDMVRIILDTYDNKNIKFLIIGAGPLKDELERYSKELDIAEYVQFKGMRHDTIELLHSMDIFILTSLYEGMSNAIMEAMASKLPCVVTGVGGNSELVEDGKTGYVLPQNDSLLLSSKVIDLIKNEDLATKMGLAGYDKINKEFSITNMVKKTEEVYLKLLTN
jgi:glycosyltransferase involved in cell wall biosynthesis